MNPGASPIDPTSNVGLLRILVGDTANVPLEPPVAGQASYAVWSDSALLGALILADDSVYRAAGDLYASLAAQYAQSEADIKTDDLVLRTGGRSASFLKLAQSFYARADAEDAAGASDFFEIASPDFLSEDSPWGASAPPAYVPLDDDGELLPVGGQPGYWGPA